MDLLTPLKADGKESLLTDLSELTNGLLAVLNCVNYIYGLQSLTREKDGIVLWTAGSIKWQVTHVRLLVVRDGS